MAAKENPGQTVRLGFIISHPENKLRKKASLFFGLQPVALSKKKFNQIYPTQTAKNPILQSALPRNTKGPQ
jgi:hypothetical protein